MVAYDVEKHGLTLREAKVRRQRLGLRVRQSVLISVEMYTCDILYVYIWQAFHTFRKLT